MRRLKQLLYFPLARYFGFFAAIQLRRWKPRIVVITGSNGKTTTLEMVKSQLGDRVNYSDKANSAYGIPFDILNLKQKNFSSIEWFYFFFAAPFKAFYKLNKENIYIVEADCDRPSEGKFLSKLLKPECVIWLSSDRTHSMNYDKLSNGNFKTVDDAIAYEYGYFVRSNPKLAIINGDNELICEQSKKLDKKDIIRISDCKEYNLSEQGTEFVAENKFKFSDLLPKKSFYSIQAAISLMKYLDLEPDLSFKHFVTPPGRSSLLKGIKNTTLVDSSYNANFSSTQAILSMVKELKNPNKWLVFGGMLEQGSSEMEEHKKLAPEIKEVNFKQIIFVGALAKKYLSSEFKDNSISFEKPKEALNYLLKNIRGDELILFKGGRMEGIVEQMLRDKSDVLKLCRREEIYAKKRRAMGLQNN